VRARWIGSSIRITTIIASRGPSRKILNNYPEAIFDCYDFLFKGAHNEYAADEAVKLLDLWSTCNVFLVGHLLHLEVSSSNLPGFDRNLNTGDKTKTGPRFGSAINTILHDAHYPSALVLPIIPSGPCH
jgi:X-Pro dipeptidyl-peptidase-like protein